MIYIQSFLIWLYTKSPLICYNRNRVNGLEHCESSILYREGFILCCPSKQVLDEHILFCRRLRRKMFALIQNKKRRLGFVPRRRFTMSEIGTFVLFFILL